MQSNGLRSAPPHPLAIAAYTGNAGNANFALRNFSVSMHPSVTGLAVIKATLASSQIEAKPCEFTLPAKLPLQWLNEQRCQYALTQVEAQHHKDTIQASMKVHLHLQQQPMIVPYSMGLAAGRAFATRSAAGQRVFRALQNMAQALIKLRHFGLALAHAQAAASMHPSAATQDTAWAAWLRSALCCKELQLWAAGHWCIQHVRRWHLALSSALCNVLQVWQ